MNAHTFRPTVIEELRRLWVALPVRAPEGMAGADPRERQVAILESYCRALAEFSPEAIRKTVDDLEAGRIEDASKDFCPKPPKLAELVRAEQRRQELANAEQKRRTTPRIEHRNEYSDEYREEMIYRFSLLVPSLNGNKEAEATLNKLVPGAKVIVDRHKEAKRAENRREGLTLVETGVSAAQFWARTWPTGSRHIKETDEVWGPNHA